MPASPSLLVWTSSSAFGSLYREENTQEKGPHPGWMDSVVCAFPGSVTHLQDRELLSQLHLQPGTEHWVYVEGERGWKACLQGRLQGQELGLLVGPGHCQPNLPGAWEQRA